MNERTIDFTKSSVSVMPTYSRLLGYLAGFRRAFLQGILGGILFAATQSSFLWFLQVFLDGAFFERDPQVLAWVPPGVVILFLLRGMGDFSQTYFMTKAARGIVKKLRTQLFERLLLLPVSHYDSTASGPLISRVVFNSEMVAQASTDSIVSLVRESLIVIGSLIYLFTVNVRLTLVALIVAPPIAVLIRSINRHFRRYGIKIQSSLGEVTRVVKDAVEAPKIIRIYNAQAFETRQFEAVNEDNRRLSLKLGLMKGLSNPVVQVIASLALAAILFIAIREALAGQLTPGEFVSFIGALANITQPLRNLVNAAGPLQQGIAAARSLFELLDAPAEVNNGSRKMARAVGEIAYRNVSFRYRGSQAETLRNLSFECSPGTVTAIVGRSGGGKSTLANLLPRLYEISNGAIEIDGTDIRDLELHSLRDQIAFVSQDPVLFNDTISNNITFGRESPPEEIERAARSARVIDFARHMESGLDTPIGDRGSLLSGGQRQRVAIARALLKDAPILILDEATASLDAETEHEIQRELETLMRDRTTLVIAHRLRTVERADRILVVDAGEIVEAGTHVELLSKNGLYATLYARQFAD